jgi:hypothetical protein
MLLATLLRWSDVCALSRASLNSHLTQQQKIMKACSHANSFDMHMRNSLAFFGAQDSWAIQASFGRFNNASKVEEQAEGFLDVFFLEWFMLELCYPHLNCGQGSFFLFKNCYFRLG